MDENQNNPFQNLKTFINSCNFDQLYTSFEWMAEENNQTYSENEIQELVVALRCLVLTPPLIAMPTVEDYSIEDRDFSFTFQPAGRLREAIGVLCRVNSNLDNDGEQVTAMIEVSLIRSVCLDVTVCRPSEIEGSMKEIGFLRLVANDERNFECRRLFERKFVDLKRIYDILGELAYDDAITIYHVDRSTEISFEKYAGNNADAARLQNVEILQDIDNPELFERWPQNIDIVSSAILPTQWLSDNVPHMLESSTKTPRQVVMEISEPVVTIKIGSSLCSYESQWNNLRIPGSSITEMEDEFVYEASFKWTSCDALLSASYLDGLFRLYFTRDQAIRFKFKVDHLGHLWFAKVVESTNFNGTNQPC